MADLVLGQISDTCLNCGEYRAAIQARYGKPDQLFCATVDYEGECMDEYDHHRFKITQKHLDTLEAERKYWESSPDNAFAV